MSRPGTPADGAAVGGGEEFRLRSIAFAAFGPATLFGLSMIVACWIGTAFVMSIERGKILEGAIQQSENLVRLFEENTVQTFQRSMTSWRPASWSVRSGAPPQPSR